MRELLGKKLTGRLRKDLDDISEKTNVPLKSCRRQVCCHYLLDMMSQFSLHTFCVSVSSYLSTCDDQQQNHFCTTAWNLVLSFIRIAPEENEI